MKHSLSCIFLLQKCVWRLSNQQNAQQHYKAVCRALATEATELLTFLDNIARGQEVAIKYGLMTGHNLSGFGLVDSVVYTVVRPICGIMAELPIKNILTQV